MSQPSEPARSRTTIAHRNRGWRGPCEAGTAFNDEFGKPLVQHCGQPGRWFSGGFLFGMVLCTEHEGLQERVAEMAMHVRDLRDKQQVRPHGRADLGVRRGVADVEAGRVKPINRELALGERPASD